MSKKPLQHIIQISNPDASKRGGFVILDTAGAVEALKVAQMVALATGRHVTLRNDKMALIATIPIPATGAH